MLFTFLENIVDALYANESSTPFTIYHDVCYHNIKNLGGERCHENNQTFCIDYHNKEPRREF